MAMAAGAVTVAADGTYMGSGLALALMTALDAQQAYPDPAAPPSGWSLASWAALAASSRKATRDYLAGQANGMAGALVGYVQAHAEVDVPPNGLAVGVPLLATALAIT